MVPYAKTGGLADVSGALPRALARLGHEVTVVLPRYAGKAPPPGDFAGAVHVPVDGVHRSAGYYVTRPEERLRVVFVEHSPFYDRPQLYGTNGHDYSDNHLRFAFLSRAALELYRSRGQAPDVFHVHDWQTGLVPVYLKAFYWDDPALGRTPTVITIHNLAYQGSFPSDTLSVLGLPGHLLSEDALGAGGRVSYLKGGINFSEIVGTVSPQYAREIQGPELGCGLEGALGSRARDLVGILNGVDYDEWDPQLDSHIVRRYSPQDLSGKAECKADLLREFSLPAEPELPVVGVVSRLVPQKGLDIVATAWWDILARPLRLVVLGTGDAGIEDGLRRLAAHAPDRVAVRFAYDDALAHKIEAGADMFLMPSRYEPCGLSQLYSLRYGTVPIVRATGGLIDSVEHFDPATGTGTGFVFATADGTGLIWALDQALGLFADRRSWERLMRNGMARDFSWQRSARRYVQVYERAMAQG
jgi:starch synthase